MFIIYSFCIIFLPYLAWHSYRPLNLHNLLLVYNSLLYLSLSLDLFLMTLVEDNQLHSYLV